MRAGAEFFTEPSGAAQRRYEAMRAYFVDEQPAARVAGQFGYSTASVHQMATLLRSGRMRLFADTRPGPKGPVKATGPVRDRVMALRARHLAVTQIAAILTEEGTPVSAQTVWKICDAEGMPRLRGDDTAGRGPAGAGPGRRPGRLAGRRHGAAVRSRRAAASLDVLRDWPARRPRFGTTTGELHSSRDSEFRRREGTAVTRSPRP